jgi:hypothetical protein
VQINDQKPKNFSVFSMLHTGEEIQNGLRICLLRVARCAAYSSINDDNRQNLSRQILPQEILVGKQSEENAALVFATAAMHEPALDCISAASLHPEGVHSPQCCSSLRSAWGRPAC